MVHLTNLAMTLMLSLSAHAGDKRVFRPNTCGLNASGQSCIKQNQNWGSCCSAKGECGYTDVYCLSSLGCQKDFGSCWTLEAQQEVSRDGRCEPGVPLNICVGSGHGDCCSKYGYCEACLRNQSSNSAKYNRTLDVAPRRVQSSFGSSQTPSSSACSCPVAFASSSSTPTPASTSCPSSTASTYPGILNPGFESGDIAGWDLLMWSTNSSGASRTSQRNPRNGTFSFLARGQPLGEVAHFELSQHISIAPNQAHVFKISTRQEGSKICSMVFWLGNTTALGVDTPEKNWKNLTFPVSAATVGSGENTKLAMACHCYRGYGEAMVFLDDITLTPVAKC
ncbi:hypothetical protein CC86DRAFT_386540 [Ophiobolus disseminans]|uniref:Chitin-binding type-1 domain-containing protein n=1 Tax=Ophiobolus disseminans TaxID=1469910 RepID=A0A6A6ZL60_9PLEO|nr:hypothetical protein CC86DRAFT_386540 [Ophiobolus disseminans]